MINISSHIVLDRKYLTLYSRYYWWLRAIAASVHFARIAPDGAAALDYANVSYGIYRHKISLLPIIHRNLRGLDHIFIRYIIRKEVRRMIVTDIGILIDVVIDAYEYLSGNAVMREIPDADIVKLFDDDTTASEIPN